MRHITTVICLLTLCFAGIQKAEAQTKEETIEWLNNNIDILMGKLSCGRVNENQTVTWHTEIKNDSLITTEKWDNSTHVSSLALKDILFQDVNTLLFSEKPYLEVCPEIKFKTLHTEKNKVNKDNGTDKRSSDWINIYYLNLENTKRVLKAIMHLAKLRGAKENKQIF